MFWFSAFFIELLLLFLLSRTLTRTISYFLYRMTGSSKVTIYTLALLFFPGTLIHELAHAISAGLMGVHVGRMEFMPKLDGEQVKLGSVQIAQTDPIRRFLIGAAPFFAGTAILLGVLFLAVQHNWFNNYLLTILVGYTVFEIGNTMFSSKKDMDGALELLGVIVALVILLYFLGIRLPSFNPNELLNQQLPQAIFKRGSFFLLIPLAIDSIIILLFKPHRH
ncbi:MAG: hypothetical protein ACR2LN_07375 [Candidatus Levyibacteriota bacterium]